MSISRAATITTPLDGLLAGLRLALGTGEPAAEREVLAGIADWQAVAALARRHQMSSRLLKGLRTDDGLLAESGIAPMLKVVCDQAIRQGLRQLDGLKRATDCLTAAGIPCIVLKGLPLCRQLYGHPFARGMVDVDLLVSPRTFHSAGQVLAKSGWCRHQPDFPETPARMRWYGRFLKDQVFTGPGGMLELHQRLAANPHYLDLPFDDLYANGAQVEIGTTPYRTLGDDDLLLYLACHGARSHWEKLKWLYDVATLLGCVAPECLERTAARCREAKLEKVLALTLRLCREAFYVPVPNDAPWMPDGGRHATLATRLAWRAWAESDADHRKRRLARTGQRLNTLFAKPDLKFVLHELASTLIEPRDWARVQLPDALFFLYFPLRPFLLLTKKGAR